MPFPVYDKKDQIPTGADDVYEERDGKWHPVLPDVAAVETTLAKVRDERKDLEKRLKDQETARATAERERDALRTQVGDPEGKTAELLKKFDTDIAKAVEGKDQEIEKLKGRLRVVTLDTTAKEAFLKAGGRPEKAETALKLARERLDLADDRPVVKDEKGQVTTDTLEKFFTESFKKSEPELYKGTQAGGGGAGGINNGGGGASGAPTGEQILAQPGVGFDAANASGA